MNAQRLVRRPNGYLYLYFRVDGKARFKSTGFRDEGEYWRAVSPPATLSDLLARFVEFLSASRKSPKTISIGRRALTLLIEHTKNKPLSLLIKSDLYEFADACRARFAEATVYAYMRAIRRALGVAGDWYPELRSADLRFRWQSRSRVLPVVLDAADVAILLDAVRVPWLRDMVRLCLYTGLRLGEVCNLRRCDVDFSRKVLTIQQREGWTPKTDEHATIPLADDAVAILSQRCGLCSATVAPQGSDYVFTVDGKKLIESSVSHVFKKIIRRTPALNQRAHFHTLRHTFATLLLRSGVGIYEVSRLMRHRSVKTTEIYLHVLSSELHSSVNRLRI